MPMTEVDEAELAAKNRVLGFVNTALANPKTRTKVLEIQKVLDPNFTAPELETRSYVDDRLGAIETLLKEDREERAKERDAEKTARDQAALNQRWLNGRETMRGRGFSDEGVGQLEEFMATKGILDHEDALPRFLELNPPPPQIETGDNRWGFFDAKTRETPDLKPLFEGNDELFLAQQIAATLAEVRGQRR